MATCLLIPNLEAAMHTTFKEMAKRVRVNPRATKAKANLPKTKDAAAGGSFSGRARRFGPSKPKRQRNDHQASPAVNDSDVTMDSPQEDRISLIRSRQAPPGATKSARDIVFVFVLVQSLYLVCLLMHKWNEDCYRKEQCRC